MGDQVESLKTNPVLINKIALNLEILIHGHF